MDDDKTMFSVTIKPIGDSSLEVLEYAITVECTSNPNYDFSPWGSGDVGRFSAVFYEKKE